MAHRNVHGGAKPPYSSGITCLQHLLRTEGLRGLTRGTGATMARETPGNALFFTVYELLRRVIPGRQPSAAPSGDGFLAILGDAASSIVCGGLAGTVMWATVLPIDVAKTRIQTATPGSPRDVGVLRNLTMMHREGEAHIPCALGALRMRSHVSRHCSFIPLDPGIQMALKSLKMTRKTAMERHAWLHLWGYS